MNMFLVCLVAALAVATGATAADTPYNKCPPDFHGTPPNCAANPYVPTKIEQCPAGTVGYPPNNCHVPCPANTRRNAAGECVGIPCPANSEGEWQPHCTFKHCPHGEVGIYPNCFIPRPVEYCPAGKVGTPPNCYVPCPAYHYGRDGNCSRVLCPKGEGWVGEYQPDCKFTPQCPADRPGTWPNCWAIYCPPDSVGVYPNCVCRAPLVGEPGSCKPGTGPTTKPFVTPKPVITPKPNKPTKEPATYLPPTNKPTTPKPTTPKPTTPKPTTPKPTTPKPTTPKPTTAKPTTPKPVTPRNTYLPAY